MRNIKILIIALLVLLVILIGVVIFLNSNSSKQNIEVTNNELQEGRQDQLIQLDNFTSKETNDNIVFSLSDVIQKLFSYIAVDDDEAVYNMTELQYIKDNNITTMTVKSIYPNVQNGVDYYIQNVYKIQNYDKSEYYIYGVILDNNKIEDSYLCIEIDTNNSAFGIKPIEFAEYNKAKNGEISQISSNTISKNKYNNFNIQSFSIEGLSRNYIKDYLFKVTYMPELAYELLEDNYKKEKFSNIDEFKTYIQNNASRFTNFTLKKYQNEINEESIQYIVTDVNDNYYKIYVYKPLEYKMVLDNYTIETEEYLEYYNNATEENRINTCIAKFFKLVNEKDYKNSYSYLDNTFKANNFNTEEKYAEYVNQNFFNNNILEIKSIEKMGEVYSCKVKIKSGVSVSAMEKELTVIVLLGEGTNFVMSFSVNE